MNIYRLLSQSLLLICPFSTVVARPWVPENRRGKHYDFTRTKKLIRSTYVLFKKNSDFQFLSTILGGFKSNQVTEKDLQRYVLHSTEDESLTGLYIVVSLGVQLREIFDRGTLHLRYLTGGSIEPKEVEWKLVPMKVYNESQIWIHLGKDVGLFAWEVTLNDGVQEMTKTSDFWPASFAKSKNKLTPVNE